MKRILPVLLFFGGLAVLPSFAQSGANLIDTQSTAALLTSTDPQIRESAFYALIQLGFESSLASSPYPIPKEVAQLLKTLAPADADSLTDALVGLLTRENGFVAASQNDPTISLSEEYVTYYGDVIAAVSALRNERSIPALIGAITSGDMATSTLAGFGNKAIDSIMIQLGSGDEDVRGAAVIVLLEMLEPTNFSSLNRRTVSKLRNGLHMAQRFPEAVVASAAREGLRILDQMKEVEDDSRAISPE